MRTNPDYEMRPLADEHVSTYLFSVHIMSESTALSVSSLSTIKVKNNEIKGLLLMSLL